MVMAGEKKLTCTATQKYPEEWIMQNLSAFSRAVRSFYAGFLPFSAIYIELYYIFASVWGHKVRLTLLSFKPFIFKIITV